MPQVPTIDETNVQPEQEQFAGIPTPPPGAFPGAVGASIEAVGAEIGRIAYEEQQKTHEIRAMEAETQYQNYLSDTVYDANKGFSSIYGRRALFLAPSVKAAINAKREEIANGLGSRYAQRLFDNNSLRTLRFAQDHVDSWAGQQRRVADDSSYKLGLVSDAQLAGQYAASPVGYHPEAADALMMGRQRKAYERAAQLGMDEEAAQDFAGKSLSVVADSLVMGLAKSGANTEIAAHELARWGPFMTPTKEAEASKLIVAQSVKDQAAKILHGAARISADPRIDADSDGKISQDSVERRLQGLKHSDGSPLSDGEKANVRHEMERQLVDLNKEYEARVKEYSGQALAAGSRGHAFIINRAESGDTMEWLRIHAPETNAALEKQSRDNGDYELRGATRSDKRTSQANFMKFQDRVLRQMDEEPDKFAALRETDTLNLGMDPPDQHRAWVMIQKYQKPGVTKLPGGSLRSQISDKLNSIYERDTGAKDHARRFLLSKAVAMDFKTQPEFDKWLDTEFQQSGTWFKSYQVEKEIEQADAAARSAAPVPPAAARGPDQKSINLGRARKVKSDPLATPAQRDWADAILKKYNEKP